MPGVGQAAAIVAGLPVWQASGSSRVGTVCHRTSALSLPDFLCQFVTCSCSLLRFHHVAFPDVYRNLDTFQDSSKRRIICSNFGCFRF